MIYKNLFCEHMRPVPPFPENNERPLALVLFCLLSNWDILITALSTIEKVSSVDSRMCSTTGRFFASAISSCSAKNARCKSRGEKSLVIIQSYFANRNHFGFLLKSLKFPTNLDDPAFWYLRGWIPTHRKNIFIVFRQAGEPHGWISNPCRGNNDRAYTSFICSW